MGGVGFVARNFEEIVAATFMVLMSLATILNVIFRYVFNQPFEWAEEFSRYAFIWLVFMGAAVTTKQRKHIIIDTLLVAMPPSARPASPAGTALPSTTSSSSAHPAVPTPTRYPTPLASAPSGAGASG